MSDRRRGRWLLPGCLILVTVIVLAVATVAGLVWWSVRSAEPQTAALVRESPDGEPTGAVPDVAQTADTTAPLKLLFELDSSEVYFEPGAPGEPLSVEAHYDTRDYLLEEIADEAEPNAYRLRFTVTSSRFITGLKQAIRGGQPQMRVRLPVDRPIEFKLVQRNGGAIIDFSGLHLTDVDFDLGGALLKVDADVPLRGDLERFRVQGGQGALVLESLNLMRPRNVAIDFRLGQATLDFRGPWTADANVDLSMSVLDAIVRLPRDARVEGLGDGPHMPASSAELPPATLTFNVERGNRATMRVFD